MAEVKITGRSGLSRPIGLRRARSSAVVVAVVAVAALLLPGVSVARSGAQAASDTAIHAAPEVALPIGDGDGDASARPAWARSLPSAQARMVSDPISVRFQWWGVIVSLDRQLGCFAATGIPELEELIKSVVPPPFGHLAVAAIRLHKGWIGRNVGTDGLDLHFSWAGFLHWVEPRGPREGC